jgi:hypothetical protein
MISLQKVQVIVIGMIVFHLSQILIVMFITHLVMTLRIVAIGGRRISVVVWIQAQSYLTQPFSVIPTNSAYRSAIISHLVYHHQ